MVQGVQKDAGSLKRDAQGGTRRTSSSAWHEVKNMGSESLISHGVPKDDGSLR